MVKPHRKSPGGAGCASNCRIAQQTRSTKMGHGKKIRSRPQFWKLFRPANSINKKEFVLRPGFAARCTFRKKRLPDTWNSAGLVPVESAAAASNSSLVTDSSVVLQTRLRTRKMILSRMNRKEPFCISNNRAWAGDEVSAIINDNLWRTHALLSDISRIFKKHSRA